MDTNDLINILFYHLLLSPSYLENAYIKTSFILESSS